MKTSSWYLVALLTPNFLLAADQTPKGVLNEIKLNKKTEAANLKTAAEAEAMISRSEELAIKQLEVLVKKYRGTSQQPNLLFRLAELYARRAKTGRFVDLYRSDKKLSTLLTNNLTSVGAKAYLAKAIENYQIIETQFPTFPAMDEVLFNRAFAHDQRGEMDLAMEKFLALPQRFPKSSLMPETHMALGELYFQKQNYTEAMSHFDLVQKWPRSPTAPIALYKSAWCSYNTKNTAEGLKKIERLLSQSQRQPEVSHVRSEAKRDLALFYSETGSVDTAISYFKKKLLSNEVGSTVLELSAIYERHGKLLEMDSILAQFLTENPKDENAGPIYLKRAHYQNEKNNPKLVMNLLHETSDLCQDSRWHAKGTPGEAFCNETYPEELTHYTTDWWESWNKLNRSKDMVVQIEFIFNEYLKFEKTTVPNVPIHMAYADFLFSQGRYPSAGLEYERISKIESIDKSTLQTSLYGHIISLDRQISTNNQDKVLREKLLGTLNEYLQRLPGGVSTEDILFKKAFLFYETKEFGQALTLLEKMSPQTPVMLQKRDDLILEIHRAKKDYPALVVASLKILKASSGERAQKINGIYEGAQQAIIQQNIEKEKFDEAAQLALAFYREHRPEPQSLEALHLAIELWEKQKHYRLAAENSEILAQEMNSAKKPLDAEKLSLHANDLFLKLGDLARAKISLQRALPLTQSETKKRDILELLAEISSWSGDVDLTEKAWLSLETQMSPAEKQQLLNKRLQFFGQYSPARAQKIEESLVDKGVEPYFSKAQFSKGEALCQANKWADCYQMALKLNKESTPAEIKRKARYLQSKVLTHEYLQQSLKASPGRMALVMSNKAEKFAKASQLLETLGSKSDDLDIRRQALTDLKQIYLDYQNQLRSSMEKFDSKNADLMALKQEIEQILPALQSRPQEIEKALNDVAQLAKTTVAQPTAQGSFPELDGSELRIYVPTWEEGTAYRPLHELQVGNKSCIAENIQKLNTLSALGREANACVIKGQSKELEMAALRMSDLFPDSVWGPYYLSISAWKNKIPEQSIWYLKLAQQRAQDSLLNYEELRKKFAQHPNAGVVGDLKKLGDFWSQTEESTFLSTIDLLDQKNCGGAAESLKSLKADYWKTTSLLKIVNRQCPPPSAQTVTSAEVPRH